MLRLNITKEEYQAQKSKKERITMLIVLGSAILFSLFGLFMKSPNLNVWASILIYGFIGGFSSLFFMGMLDANSPPETPFCVFEYFEEEQEKVLGCQNIGTKKHTGKGSYYEASNFFEVRTDKSIYLIEVNNNKIISSSEKQ